MAQSKLTLTQLIFQTAYPPGSWWAVQRPPNLHSKCNLTKGVYIHIHSTASSPIDVCKLVVGCCTAAFLSQGKPSWSSQRSKVQVPTVLSLWLDVWNVHHPGKHTAGCTAMLVHLQVLVAYQHSGVNAVPVFAVHQFFKGGRVACGRELVPHPHTSNQIDRI